MNNSRIFALIHEAVQLSEAGKLRAKMCQEDLNFLDLSYNERKIVYASPELCEWLAQDSERLFGKQKNTVLIKGRMDLDQKDEICRVLENVDIQKVNFWNLTLLEDEGKELLKKKILSFTDEEFFQIFEDMLFWRIANITKPSLEEFQNTYKKEKLIKTLESGTLPPADDAGSMYLSWGEYLIFTAYVDQIKELKGNLALEAQISLRKKSSGIKNYPILTQDQVNTYYGLALGQSVIDLLNQAIKDYCETESGVWIDELSEDLLQFIASDPICDVIFTRGFTPTGKIAPMDELFPSKLIWNNLVIPRLIQA